MASNRIGRINEEIQRELEKVKPVNPDNDAVLPEEE